MDIILVSSVAGDPNQDRQEGGCDRQNTTFSQQLWTSLQVLLATGDVSNATRDKVNFIHEIVKGTVNQVTLIYVNKLFFLNPS